jgi:hypothetical protein
MPSVAPGWYGGEAACAANKGGCPDYATEAMRAGAARHLSRPGVGEVLRPELPDIPGLRPGVDPSAHQRFGPAGDRPAASGGRLARVDVTFRAPDAAADNGFTFCLVNPSGKVVDTASAKSAGPANLYALHPVAGLWQIDVVLNLTESGKQFTETVSGSLKDPS